MKLLAVEGPDGAGKTTFVADFLKVLPDDKTPVWHSGGPVATAPDFQRRMSFVRSHSKLIVDRLPLISELVYCTALNKPFLVPPHDLWRSLVALNPVVVYCRLEDVDQMLQNMIRGKPHKSEKYYEELRTNYPRIVNEYDQLMNKLLVAGVQVFFYNWKIHNAARVLPTIHRAFDYGRS